VSVWIPVIAAGGAAVLAAVAAVWGAKLQRKSGEEAAEAARESARAAQVSSDASTRSAKAAEDSVELNRVIAKETGSRADASALAERYQDAASQLGHDKAAVRLAGVYAMSRLADDWPDERQTCIDVLCAYLRLPWLRESKLVNDDMQVRRTIVSVINRHVAEDAKVSWATNDFDFTRAQLSDFLLERCTFAGRVTFSEAEFTGECKIDDVAFQGGASFAGCAIHDCVKLDDIRAGGRQQLTFAGARIAPDAELEITTNTKDPEDASRWQDYRSMKVEGKLKIRHTYSSFRQPPLDLDHTKLAGGCIEIVPTVSLTKDRRPRYPYRIMARDWKISPGSQILIPQEFIDNDTVHWAFVNSRPDIPVDVEMTFKVPTVDS
jgi:hypothetical protein